jgi:hypothetical protein
VSAHTVYLLRKSHYRGYFQKRPTQCQKRVSIEGSFKKITRRHRGRRMVVDVAVRRLFRFAILRSAQVSKET